MNDVRRAEGGNVAIAEVMTYAFECYTSKILRCGCERDASFSGRQDALTRVTGSELAKAMMMMVFFGDSA
jgi:hypothetical protein